MLRRTVVMVGLVACLIVAGTAPVLADGRWGNVDCSQNPHPGCELWAGRDGNGQSHDRKDSSQRRSGSRRQADGESSEDESERPADRLIGKNKKAAKCRYVHSDFQPPRSTTQPAAFVSTEDRHFTEAVKVAFAADAAGAGAVPSQLAPSQGGAWYVYRCSTPGFRDALWRAPVWIPDGQDTSGGPALPSPEQLAQLARDQLLLPDPTIMASPAGEQLVQLPTWLWLDPEDWNEVTATASVPGVSVTAIARPTSVSWSMGDGGSTTCNGPGTAYTSKTDPRSSSPDCGYTYRSSSAGRPGLAFPVRATVRWIVTWFGAGQSGVFPDVTMTDSTQFRVAESQALNTE